MKDRMRELRRSIRALAGNVKRAFESGIAGTIDNVGKLADPLAFIRGLDADWLLSPHVTVNGGRVNKSFELCANYRHHFLIRSAIRNIMSYSRGIEGFKVGAKFLNKPADQLSETEKKSVEAAEARLNALYRECNIESLEADILTEPLISGEVCFLIESGGLSFQLINSQRIATPRDRIDAVNVNDGVVRNERGFVVGYYIDGSFVHESEVFFRKYNVSSNHDRGSAEIWPLVNNGILSDVSKNVKSLSEVTVLKNRIPGIVSYPPDQDAADFGNDFEAQGDATVDLTSELNSIQESNFRLNFAAQVSRGVKGLQWLFTPEDYEWKAAPFENATADGSIKTFWLQAKIVGGVIGQPPYMLVGEQETAGFGSSGLEVASDPARARFAERSAEAAKVIAELLRRALRARGESLPTGVEIVVNGPESNSSEKDRRERVFGSVDRGIMSLRTAREEFGLNDNRESVNIEAENQRQFESDGLV